MKEELTKTKKILFICATSKMVLNFRADLIKKFQENGYSVSVVAFDDKYSKEISGLGVNFYCANDNNRSVNIFKFLSLKGKYLKLIKEIQPDIVFTFMMKPNIFGVRAAKKAGVKKIFSMVEGAGDVFVYNSLKWRAIRFVVTRLYRKAFKCVNSVFFLNNDDKAEFVRRKLVDENKSLIVHGIGVNTYKFAFSEVKNEQTFLMVARLTHAKGVMEYCKASRIVKKKYPTAQFELLGGEGAITVEDIKEYIDDGSIVYYGETDDVVQYLDNAGVFVLPSYREGFPVSTMEAQAIGRAVITTDSVGCKDTVNDGYNGFLIETKNVDALVEKLVYFINNPEAVKTMGKNARKYAEENFCHNKINQSIFNVVNCKGEVND